MLKLKSKERNDLQEHQREQEIIHNPGYKPSETERNFRDRQLDLALSYLRNQINTAKAANTAKRNGG